MDDTPRPGDDDLAALDFSVPGGPSEASDLDALSGFGEPDPHLDSDHWHDHDRDDEGPSDPLFAVTNPPGTVTVSAHIDGRVHHIDLSPKAATLTEGHLAAEIVVIARLAAQEARAAQYAFMLDGMRAQGHDDSATRDFLTRDLDLPSPQEATADRARVFATRYAGDQ